MEGVWGACESLGEALVFLTAYVYWKKKCIVDNRNTTQSEKNE